MLLLTNVRQFSNLLKINDFLVRYVNCCPECKILSWKHPHLQFLIQSSQFYTGTRHKLRKSKYCYFFNITLPWVKMWRWWCKRYLRNYGFLLCEKFQCLKFKYTEVINKKLFFSFLEMHNCVWYLWTCPYLVYH